MTEEKPRPHVQLLGFAVFVLVPSFDTVGKYFGPAGIAVYSLLGVAAIYAFYFLFLPFFRKHVSEKTALRLALATLVGLIVMVAIAYPLANSGRFGGGSDVDDATIVAVGEMLKGNYAYYPKTYLGLPISPLPGALFLAVPWVIASALQFQNILWLVVLFMVLRQILQSNVSTVAFFWAVPALSPTVLQSLVTGSDYIANTIYVLFSAWLVLRYAADGDASVWKKLAAAAFLGVGLSSRSNFLLVLPMLFIVLVRTAGWRKAIRSAAIAGGAFALITIPFWAYDPAGFSPMTAQSFKVKVLEEVLPFAGILIPGSALMIAVALSLRKNAADAASFFRDHGIIQLYLVLFSSIVFSIHRGELNLYMANSGYGLFALFFGAAGCWLILKNEPATAHSPLD